MKRAKRGNTDVTIGASVSAEHLTALDAAASRANCSRAQIIRVAVADFLSEEIELLERESFVSDLIEALECEEDYERLQKSGAGERIAITAKWLSHIQQFFPDSCGHAADNSWTQATFRNLPRKLRQRALDKVKGAI